jgi:hypothetical protein
MLHLPARDIPIPASVSPQAQAIMSAPRPPMPPEPPAHDTDAWRRQAAMINQAMTPIMKARASGVAAAVKDILVDGVTVYDIVPAGADVDDPRIYFDIHGGPTLPALAKPVARRRSALPVRLAIMSGPWTTVRRPITSFLRRSTTA